MTDHPQTAIVGVSGTGRGGELLPCGVFRQKLCVTQLQRRQHFAVRNISPHFQDMRVGVTEDVKGADVGAMMWQQHAVCGGPEPGNVP